MSRRSLRPQLNQIRAWVRQGRTDAWIAHQLEATVQQVQAFKREHDLEADGEQSAAGEEVDLRAADDAQIAVELEEEERRRREEEEERRRQEEEDERRRAEEEKARAEAGDEAPPARARRGARKPADADGAEDSEPADEDDAKPKRRRRSNSGGRSRRRTGAGKPLEATFDHGEEGYGLWLDPAVIDDPVYAEHWAGHRPVEVMIEEDQIVIRRAGSGEDEDA